MLEPASGGRRRPRPTRRPSASTSRRSTRRSGWLSWERIARAWEAAQGSDEAMRASATPSSARPGSRPARRRTGSGSTTGARTGRSGTVPRGRAVPDRRRRRAEGPDRGRRLGLGPRPGKLAGRSCRHRRRTGACRRRWDGARGAARPRPGRTPAAPSCRLARLAIDTGYEAPAVYAWARAQGFAQVAPIKGVEGFNRASPVSGPTYVDATEGGKRLRRGARLWTVAVSTFKAETYRFLRLERPTDEEIAGGARMPPGTIHLPDWVDVRMAEAVRRRAAGHGEDQARLRPAGMAEAPGAQRGARLPGLRPRRRLDRRPRPLVRAQVARIWRSSWGSRRKRRHPARCRRSPNKRRAPIHRRVGAPCGPAGWEGGAELAEAWIIQSEADHDLVTSRIGRAQKAYASGRCG